MYFQYGDEAIEYLSARDERLAGVIRQIGHIEREVDGDLFSAVVHQIVGQQISMKALATVWMRLLAEFGNEKRWGSDMAVTINPERIYQTTLEELQAVGISFRKASYIKEFAEKVCRGEFDLEAIYEKADEEVIAELSALRGIGKWTAEMIMLFCMQRQDILSFDDMAIQRGMRMLYHHRKIDKKLFEKYRRRYSPYGSVASLYLWAISGGAIPGMKDYAPKQK